ncbi:MAG: 23S rRNA (pseudouridine(1915)-N(3))-methyltransferase RlmH [Dissulfurimicrobium sp.]|uniref:23S rRNA (pseudouridine(1915)-N(3))-methyltransferase RlmH n=1 Tax=Dissulfurimicrobium sp. TaxID=2022436 RepID=UPI00404B1170
MLKLTLIWIDKTKKPWLRRGIDEYVSRLNHYMTIAIKEIKGGVYTLKSDRSKLLAIESQSIKKAIPRGAFTVALHNKGRLFDSPGLAAFLEGLDNRGIKDLAIIIGGPFGLDKQLIDEMDERISLSRLTFTHDMSRLILLEQLYRASTIRMGKAYHH